MMPMLFFLFLFLLFVIAFLGSIHFPGTKIYEFYEDKDLQVEEACNPDPKSVDENVEISLEPSSSGEPKHLQTNSNTGISCEGNMFGAQAKVENLDQLENSSKIYLTSPCAVTDVTTFSIDEVPFQFWSLEIISYWKL